MSGDVEDDWDQDQGVVQGEDDTQLVEEAAYQQQQEHQVQTYEDDTQEAYHEDYQQNEGGMGEEEENILDMGEGMGGGMLQHGEEDILLMRFCPHDSSMLYPQEDKRTRTLRHACRLCRYSEESHTPLIYRNRLKKEVKNVLNTVPGAVSDDPTLPRSQNASCENCGHNEAVFFQSDTSDVRADSLALIFVCCNCDHKWVG